jgi:hypothetical protein
VGRVVPESDRPRPLSAFDFREAGERASGIRDIGPHEAVQDALYGDAVPHEEQRLVGVPVGETGARGPEAG